MNKLAAHKRLLLLESELNRQNLRTHCSEIGSGLDRAKRFVDLGRKTSPLLMLAVAAGGFFAVKKQDALTSVLGKAVSGWQLLRTLQPLWRSFVSKPTETAPQPAPQAQDYHE